MGNNQNASSTLTKREDDLNDQKVTINTIQRTAYVERLPVSSIANSSSKHIPYDVDDLYPNKVRSIAQRSGSVTTAISTLSAFVSGAGFEDENANKIIINSEGQTLGDILRFTATEKSTFKGLALHFNYNILGEIIEINEVSFENCRVGKDEKTIYHSTDWRKKYEYEVYHVFDQEKVKEQIQQEGIDKYKGQILYWIPRKKDVYTTCRFDAVLDDAQFEAEAKIYKLSNVQNEYSANMLFKYPSNLDTKQEAQDVINDIKGSRGSKNAGKTKALPLPPMGELSNWKFFEEIPRTGIDKMHNKQNEESRFSIYALFQQPPILNGITKDGMFNAESFVDAFDYYNSFTETDRMELSDIFTKILAVSIWNIPNTEIKPKEFKREREKEDGNIIDIKE